MSLVGTRPPTVAPYIEEQEKKIKEARKLLEENLLYGTVLE